MWLAQKKNTSVRDENHTENPREYIEILFARTMSKFRLKIQNYSIITVARQSIER